MKNIGYKPQNLLDVARMAGLINDRNEHLKFTLPELAAMVVKYIDSLESRLDKAKGVYREQRDKLARLESPELWRFEAPKSIPPDYRAEYLRRLKEGVHPISENGLRLIKTTSGRIEEGAERGR